MPLHRLVIFGFAVIAPILCRGQNVIATVAGGGTDTRDSGIPATSAALFPTGVVADNAGNIYIADMSGVRKVNTAGIITTVAPISGWGVALDSAGNLYATEGHRVRKVTPAGVVTTIAGTGPPASVGTAARQPAPC